MKKRAALFGLAILLGAGPVLAQVTLDPRALDMLGTGEGDKATDTDHPAYHLESPRIVAPVKPTVTGPQAVTMPRQPTPTPQLPPAITVPVRNPGPAPAIPVNSEATGRVENLPNGVRVTFGTDQYMLNRDTVAAIEAFAKPLRARPDVEVAVDAYAAGSPNDPSSPRRMSLKRALAVRAVLLSQGISSPNILVRAMGAASGPGWADRVDITKVDPDRHP